MANVSSVGKGWVQGYGDETPKPMPQSPPPPSGPGIDASGKVHGMAKGGKVAQKRKYVVGEKGPELFVPKTAGRIIPNAKKLSRPHKNGQISERAHERMESKRKEKSEQSKDYGGKDDMNVPGATA